MSEDKSLCFVCGQYVSDIGPWCRLYLTDRFCPPLAQLRRECREADAIGDGALVNGICYWIRKNCGDNYVP